MIILVMLYNLLFVPSAVCRKSLVNRNNNQYHPKHILYLRTNVSKHQKKRCLCIKIPGLIISDLLLIILLYRPIQLPIFLFINTHPTLFKVLSQQHLNSMLHATVDYLSNRFKSFSTVQPEKKWTKNVYLWHWF